jgi:pimeloyl-ACP methyl ester carboxylesterase
MNFRLSSAWFVSVASTVIGVGLTACGQSDPESDAEAAAEMSSPGDEAAATAPAADGIDVSMAMPPDSIPIFPTDTIARKGFYYAGGDYVGDPPIMGGQMYVEVWEPAEMTQPYPIVLFHGNGQTGVDWQQTPDGRPGWAYYLVDQGYTLYMVDYPARGRSTYIPGGPHGDLGIRTAEQLETIWTNVGEKGDFPLKDNHTQWPGGGHRGDPIFDTFNKTQVQFAGESTTMARFAAMELLDVIGSPVILMTHSQGGGVGWGVADGRSELVSAIVTIEPGGPPIGRVDTANATYVEGTRDAWGPTNYPLAYDPATSDPSEISTYLEEEGDQPGEVPCYLQQEPARQLVNLRDIPVLAISANGTYHRVFDACIPKWLNQAGVDAEFVRLEDVGIMGNGHMMMLEQNSDEIIAFIHNWIQDNVDQ